MWKLLQFNINSILYRRLYLTRRVTNNNLASDSQPPLPEIHLVWLLLICSSQIWINTPVELFSTYLHLRYVCYFWNAEIWIFVLPGNLQQHIFYIGFHITFLYNMDNHSNQIRHFWKQIFTFTIRHNEFASPFNALSTVRTVIMGTRAPSLSENQLQATLIM